MERARDILGVRQDWLGFVDSGWPEGDPKPPLPEGCFALVPLEEAAAPLVAADPRVPAARHDDVRRARRLPAPRPRQVPRGLRRAPSRRPATRSATPTLGEPWQPLKLYYHHSFNRPRMQAIHDAMLAHGLESPWAERLQGVEARARVGRPDHHPGAVRGLLRRARPGAAGPRHPDRPGRLLVRDPARAPGEGLADRGLRAGASATSTARPPRTTCSPASRALSPWPRSPGPPETLGSCSPCWSALADTASRGQGRRRPAWGAVVISSP